MEELQGRIEDCIYHNGENFYTVALIQTEDGDEVTVVGYLPETTEGRLFLFQGEWKEHPAYGTQFSFQSFQEILPVSIEGITAFLSSGVIRGVGAKSAVSLVNRFGENTLKIIEQEPHRLTEVDGIGPKSAEKIARSYMEHRAVGTVLLYLQNYGIPTSYAMRLYQAFGEKTIEVIKENPYRIIDAVSGFGFRKADAIAEKLGFQKDSEYRIAGGVKFLLQMMAGEGHTFLPAEVLAERAANVLSVPEERVREVLPDMAISGEIRLDKLDGRTSVYLLPFFMAETNSCRILRRLIEERRTPLTSDVEGLSEKAERDLGIVLAQDQREAVRGAAENGVCIITGGPGTGKTTVIHAMVRVFEASGLKVAIAAPTGRAAKRITEASGYEAKTIHRLLEYSYGGEDGRSLRFGRNQENPVEADVIIVDEASMIDILLMNALLNGVKSGARLVFVGDADQLPPVGAGNVLRDMIECEIIHVVRLTEIFRQARESLITVNAHCINRGEYPSINEKDGDFFFLQRRREAEAADTIVDLCSRRLPAYFKELNPLRDVQVLSPVKKGNLGVGRLNEMLQSVLNPENEDKKELRRGDRIFREGDKVMQTKNDYERGWRRLDDYSEGQGIFNGDIGFIKSIDTRDNLIVVVFEDVKAANYDVSGMEALELAYAVTVHKSQGSEYPVVVMPAAWFPPVLATRNLLYTAVTRAKKAVVVVGDREWMNFMVDNHRITLRYSGLKIRLGNILSIEEQMADYDG